MGKLHDRLHGRLWHTTHPERFRSIVAKGRILVEPDIPETERWGCPENLPFVRVLGGVSLFDFHAFDTEAYQRSHPLSSWPHFVPYRRQWGGAVWLEIDRNQIGQSFTSADRVVELWDRDGSRSHNVMPRIEAAHIGDIPISAVSSAFITWDNGNEVREFDVERLDVEHVSGVLAEWKPTKPENDPLRP